MIQLSVHPGDWLVSIDLKDAYFHVPVAADFLTISSLCSRQRALKIHLSLPFTLTTSPCVFSKVSLAVVALLRVKGVHLHHYLDDLLLLAQNKGQFLEHRSLVISTLQEFGWLLNLEKSHLEPT